MDGFLFRKVNVFFPNLHFFDTGRYISCNNKIPKPQRTVYPAWNCFFIQSRGWGRDSKTWTANCAAIRINNLIWWQQQNNGMCMLICKWKARWEIAGSFPLYADIVKLGDISWAFPYATCFITYKLGIQSMRNEFVRMPNVFTLNFNFNFHRTINIAFGIYDIPSIKIFYWHNIYRERIIWFWVSNSRSPHRLTNTFCAALPALKPN